MELVKDIPDGAVTKVVTVMVYRVNGGPLVRKQTRGAVFAGHVIITHRQGEPKSQRFIPADKTTVPEARLNRRQYSIRPLRTMPDRVTLHEQRGRRSIRPTDDCCR